MNSKELLLAARDLHDDAYHRHIDLLNFYRLIQHGEYAVALKYADRLKLQETHTELYNALQTRADQQ